MNTYGLLNLQALFVDDSDSHAQQGAHVRVSHHPLLGLPLAPFVLERADISRRGFESLKLNDTAVFENSAGQRLFPPFTIQKDDEITVTLGGGFAAVALWAELLVDTGTSDTGGQVLVPGERPVPDVTLPDLDDVIGTGRIPPVTGRIEGIFNRNDVFGRVLDSDALGRLVGGRRGTVLDISRGENPLSGLARKSRITVTAHISSARDGTVAIGSRTVAPFAFAGTGLKTLVVRGQGTVLGARWLDAATAQKKLQFQTVDVLNLPHEGGRRYMSLSNWAKLCDRRRDDQSPKRRPLQDTAQAPARFSAPLHARADEKSRVGTLFGPARGVLDALINDSLPQHQQMQVQDLRRDDGRPVLENGTATAEIASLPVVLQATIDPGVGSYLGYKTLDTDKNRDVEQRLSFYRVRGYFRNPTDDLVASGGPDFTLSIRALRGSSTLLPPSQMFELFTSAAGTWLAGEGITVSTDLENRSGYQILAYAVADHLAPLDPVAPPAVSPSRHLDWQPSPADAPLRSAETDINGLVAGATVAAKRRAPPTGAQWDNLNAAVDDGAGVWHKPLVAGIPDPDDFDGPVPAMYLHRVDTPAGDFTMFAAQQDMFGRSSEWAKGAGEAGPRPKPPRPALVATYKQPDTATGLHSGTITATIPLPEPETLAPGAFALDVARLWVTPVGSATQPVRVLPVSTTVSIHPDAPVPATEDRRAVQIAFDGPPVDRADARDVILVARWVDTQGQESAPSEEIRLTLRDPYPPLQIPVPDIVNYSARPDATGKAWVERAWPAGGALASYGVYYTDENRLRDHLGKSGAAGEALLDQLDAAGDPAARATLLRANQGLFPAHLFERLKDAVTIDGATASFRHALSGSLRVLSGYKVAVEAAGTAARPDLSTVDTVFYAVPNSDPPPQPVVTAKSAHPEAGEPDLVTELTVTLRAGVTAGAVARLRRTRSGVVDPLRNPVIGTAPFGPPDPATGLQTAVFRDIGTALIAPNARFAPFVKYAWIAEAQGVEEPGSAGSAGGAVAGLWSKPSAPVTLEVIPQTPPVAPQFTGMTRNAVSGGAHQVALSYSYPQDLVAGTVGPWVIRVERALPDAPLAVISETPAGQGTGFVVAGDPDPARVLPSGTRFRVRVIDPVGRESPADEQFVP